MLPSTVVKVVAHSPGATCLLSHAIELKSNLLLGPLGFWDVFTIDTKLGGRPFRKLFKYDNKKIIYLEKSSILIDLWKSLSKIYVGHNTGSPNKGKTNLPKHLCVWVPPGTSYNYFPGHGSVPFGLV